MTAIVSFVAGALLGILGAFLWGAAQQSTAKKMASGLYEDAEKRQKEQIAEIVKNLQAQFGSLSLDALSKQTDQFLALAGSKFQNERELSGKELETKKILIDHQLESMKDKLQKVSDLVQSLEKDRENKFGELTSELKNTNQQVTALHQATSTLNEALANSRARGQWGQRMAEDVLRLAGFAENINYLKEKTIEGIGSRPDITFLLPKNLKLNMDVKFPYDNYMRFLEAPSDADKEKFKSIFFKDVRAKLKEITSRDYINPEQNTVDYVILFVPNEQIFSFIHEQDRDLLDLGLKNKVIFCSPITLFAVLGIIRQSVDNFSLEKTSNEILSLLGTFKSQWEKFLQKLDVVGKKIEDAQKEYYLLSTTRKSQLEKPLNKIDALRQQRGLLVSPEDPVLEIVSEEDTSSEHP